MAGFNRLRDVVTVAQRIVAARIAASEQHREDALKLLEQAVAAEDKLAYNEPADWFFPRAIFSARSCCLPGGLGSRTGLSEDLRRNPRNGWALRGLAAALKAQGRAGDAARTTRELDAVWQHADIQLPGFRVLVRRC